VVPHPYRRYHEAAAVPVFFEIYNLEPGRGDVCDYSVDYRIVPMTPRPEGFLSAFKGTESEAPEVSSRFRSTSTGVHDPVHIFIRADNLWPGEYTLEIEVTDEVSNAQVSREATFYLIE
jgi:hypothetical protein